MMNAFPFILDHRILLPIEWPLITLKKRPLWIIMLLYIAPPTSALLATTSDIMYIRDGDIYYWSRATMINYQQF